MADNVRENVSSAYIRTTDISNGDFKASTSETNFQKFIGFNGTVKADGTNESVDSGMADNVITFMCATSADSDGETSTEYKPIGVAGFDKIYGYVAAEDTNGEIYAQRVNLQDMMQLLWNIANSNAFFGTGKLEGKPFGIYLDDEYTLN